MSADDLTAGETLSTPDGQTETVVGTTTVAEPQGVLVYNITVADDHTYFVEGFGSTPNADGTTSATGSFAGPLDAVWVHNTCAAAKAAAYAARKAEEDEVHHLLPRQFAAVFKKVGLNIEDYTINLDKATHRLKPDGIHAGPRAESWNGVWDAFIKEAKGKLTKEDVLAQLTKDAPGFWNLRVIVICLSIFIILITPPMTIIAGQNGIMMRWRVTTKLFIVRLIRGINARAVRG